MIVLFTDFGHQGPYVGEMTAVLRRHAPEIPVVELMADAPAFDACAAAYLLAAASGRFPPQSVFLCVIDPGVGSTRAPGVLRADGRVYVGPDNGLLEMVIRRAEKVPTWHDILWRPAELSASFHGRDLFAPVAARLARGLPVDTVPRDLADVRRPAWPDDLAQIVHIDRYGNAVTGLRARSVGENATLVVGSRRVSRVTTFSDVPEGCSFWYNNSNGLVEIAVNRGRADESLAVGIGSTVRIEGV